MGTLCAGGTDPSPPPPPGGGKKKVAGLRQARTVELPWLVLVTEVKRGIHLGPSGCLMIPGKTCLPRVGYPEIFFRRASRAGFPPIFAADLVLVLDFPGYQTR